MRVLIVRLGALGDIVHTLPLAAALRRGLPRVGLDWVVDERHRAILDLVPAIDRVVVFRSRRGAPWRAVTGLVRELRQQRYDAALDAQGLVKSSLVARFSGARRVIGFAPAHLRERGARVFYSETCDPGAARHVVARNLALATTLDVQAGPWEFPIAESSSSLVAEIRRGVGGGDDARFLLLNPGGGWPNKRWPAERFGELAYRVEQRHGLRSVALWGSGDEPLARAVVARSGGTAGLAPPTSIADLVALSRAATLMVSGDTGPLHVAAAVGTPVVGIYGPTDPQRNGPWSPADVVVSRYAACGCRFKRRCRRAQWCLADVSVDDVVRAVERRLTADN